MVPNAKRRAELLSADTVRYLEELAAEAPPLTDEQRDIIRAAFKRRTGSVRS